MSLIEKVKEIFKPKPTFDQFAVVISSDVRMAIIQELGLMREPWENYNFEQIKHRVSDRLDRQVSRGSLTWHLEKLKDGNIIEVSPSLTHPLWKLTSIGGEILKLLEKVDREIEIEVPRRKSNGW